MFSIGILNCQSNALFLKIIIPIRHLILNSLKIQPYLSKRFYFGHSSLI